MLPFINGLTSRLNPKSMVCAVPTTVEPSFISTPVPTAVILVSKLPSPMNLSNVLIGLFVTISKSLVIPDATLAVSALPEHADEIPAIPALVA